MVSPVNFDRALFINVDATSIGGRLGNWANKFFFTGGPVITYSKNTPSGYEFKTKRENFAAIGVMSIGKVSKWQIAVKVVMCALLVFPLIAAIARYIWTNSFNLDATYLANGDKEGVFQKNGHLKEGRITNSDGDETIGEYDVNGDLVQGRITRENGSIEQGVFEKTQDGTKLVRGIKHNENTTKSGLFEKGQLVEGTMTINSEETVMYKEYRLANDLQIDGKFYNIGCQTEMPIMNFDALGYVTQDESSSGKYLIVRDNQSVYYSKYTGDETQMIEAQIRNT